MNKTQQKYKERCSFSVNPLGISKQSYDLLYLKGYEIFGNHYKTRVIRESHELHADPNELPLQLSSI